MVLTTDALMQQIDEWLHDSGPNIDAPGDVNRELVRREIAAVKLLTACRAALHAHKDEQRDIDGGWTPAVLTEYEIGRAVLAAQIIARSDKPVAEVGGLKLASTEALEEDLRECLKRAGRADHVNVWTRATSGGRVRYGFYRDAWVPGALDFLDRADLSDADRAWISGLLFGYRADAIQQFISRTVTVNSAKAAVTLAARIVEALDGPPPLLCAICERHESAIWHHGIAHLGIEPHAFVPGPRRSTPEQAHRTKVVEAVLSENVEKQLAQLHADAEAALIVHTNQLQNEVITLRAENARLLGILACIGGQTSQPTR